MDNTVCLCFKVLNFSVLLAFERQKLLCVNEASLDQKSLFLNPESAKNGSL